VGARVGVKVGAKGVGVGGAVTTSSGGCPPRKGTPGNGPLRTRKPTTPTIPIQIKPIRAKASIINNLFEPSASTVNITSRIMFGRTGEHNRLYI
jgi:hypothetical protein